MGLGTKRICQQCSVKFYDLEKDPIICPKCGATHNPEALLKPKRGRKKASATPDAVEIADDEIEINIDDESLEDAEEEAVAEELDEDIRDEMEIDPDALDEDEDDVIGNLEVDADDIIEGDDLPEKE